MSNKIKVNSFYYERNILKTIFEKEILDCFVKEINKIKLSIAKVYSYNSKSIAAYLVKKIITNGNNCVSFHEARMFKNLSKQDIEFYNSNLYFLH